MISHRLRNLATALEEAVARDEPPSVEQLRLVIGILEQCAVGAMAMEACVVPMAVRLTAEDLAELAEEGVVPFLRRSTGTGRGRGR